MRQNCLSNHSFSPPPRLEPVRHHRIPALLGTLTAAHREFGQACRALGPVQGAKEVATISQRSLELLWPLLNRFGGERLVDADSLQVPAASRPAGTGLQGALHDLYALHAEIECALMVLDRAGRTLRDGELIDLCRELAEQSRLQRDWLQSEIQAQRPDQLH